MRFNSIRLVSPRKSPRNRIDQPPSIIFDCCHWTQDNQTVNLIQLVRILWLNSNSFPSLSLSLSLQCSRLYATKLAWPFSNAYANSKPFDRDKDIQWISDDNDDYWILSAVIITISPYDCSFWMALRLKIRNREKKCNYSGPLHVWDHESNLVDMVWIYSSKNHPRLCVQASEILISKNCNHLWNENEWNTISSSQWWSIDLKAKEIFLIAFEHF